MNFTNTVKTIIDYASHSDLDVYEVLDDFTSNRPSAPTFSLNRPTISHTPVEAEIEIYKTQIQVYNEAKAKYVDEIDTYWKDFHIATDLIMTYIEQAAGITNVPEQYRKKVKDKASSKLFDGYYKVYDTLVELVDIFE